MPTLELNSGTEEKILEEAIQSPSIAMMRLSLEIDRQLRLILAVIGRLRDYNGRSPSEALDLISLSNEGAAIPSELRETITSFWDLRNHVVHGSSSDHGYAMRAIDYGFRIIRMIQKIPRPSYIVVASCVPLFSDRLCAVRRPDVNGVILESFGSKGENFGRHIYPTRKSYSEGQEVSWEWYVTGGGQWNETWYREPHTGSIEIAWSGSVEFAGRPLDQI
jgi:hypothetical protein